MGDGKPHVQGRSAAGLPESWPAVVEELLVPMYRYVATLAPAGAVDDIVQETFAAASRGIGRFDQRCTVWHWLRTIARNKIADYHRRNGSRDLLRMSLDALNSDGEQVQQALVSESPLPDETCERQEFQALARVALATLAPEEQGYLVGRYYEALSLEDLGRRFGTSPSLANTRLYRARQALREAFLGLLSGEPDDQESSS